jgi:V8-like Glu-specific endopeptidase
MYQRFPTYALGLVAAAGLATGAFLMPQSAAAQQLTLGADGKTTGLKLSTVSASLAAQARAANKPMPLPQADIGKMFGGGEGRTPETVTSLRIPYTTNGAYADPNSGTPVEIYPFRAIGKLFMFQNSNFVGSCSASVIAKGLVVTAAHCIASFGAGFSVTSVLFEPAHHSGAAPYGTWAVNDIWAPNSYLNGTDVCPQSGVVCENDLAILVMATGTGSFAGKHIAQVVGKFRFYIRNQGYTPFILDNRTRTAQITTLGYPGSLDSGAKMQRTDSIGIQQANNQVIIGSNQSQGTSGGPWFMNFGRPSKRTGTTQDPKPFGKFGHVNRLVGVTSYVNNSNKLLGASRFNNNRAFPAPGRTNIQALIKSACDNSPSNC